MEKYYVETMKDNKLISVEVTKEVYDFFEDEEKLEERLSKADQRHLDSTDLDETLETLKKGTSVEDQSIYNELRSEIYDFLDGFTQTQKNVFILTEF